MDSKKLKKEYEYAKDGQNLPDSDRISRNLNFIKILLSDNSHEMIDYHYSLLQERNNKSLYQQIRAAFKKRPHAENFLTGKLATEDNPLVLGDILHLLGALRSAHALPLARQFANSNNDYQREVALYVLGWVGNELDITILNKHLLNEELPHLRITAASAHRQLYYRLPDLKSKLLLSLKRGFENEKNDEVIAWIIIMIESISLKRLGLREDKEDPYLIHGDIQKSKLKTSKFLSGLSFNTT